MKAQEGSRRFSDPKKSLAPWEVLRKFGWRRGVVCEKLCRRLQEFGKKVPGVQMVNNPSHHRIISIWTYQVLSLSVVRALKASFKPIILILRCRINVSLS